MINQSLIDKVQKIRTTLNEISVYNLDVKTALELYYELAKKVNEVINELINFEGDVVEELQNFNSIINTEINRFENLVSEDLRLQNEKIQTLLNEGMKEEVVLKVSELISNGTIQDLINKNIFNDLNNKIESAIQQLNNLRYDIVIVGDSLSKGDDGQSYKGLANIKDWLTFFTRYNIKDNGVWGNTLDGVISNLKTEVLDLKPKYCIILCGTNDISNGVGTNTMIVKTRTIMETLLLNNITPIFISIPPRNDNTSYNQKIREFNNKLEYQCIRRNCYFIDVYTHLCKDDGSAKDYLLRTTDNLHWTSYGAYECAKIVKDYIPPLGNYQNKLFSRLWSECLYSNFEFTQFDTVTSGQLAHNWTEINTCNATFSKEENPNKSGFHDSNYQVITKAGSSTVGQAGISQEVGGYLVGGTYRTELDIDWELTSHEDDTNTSLVCCLTVWHNDGTATQYHKFVETYGLQNAKFRPYFDLLIPITKRKMLLEVYGYGKSGFKLKVGRVNAYLLG